MTSAPGAPGPRPPQHRLVWLTGTAVWLLTVAYLLPRAFRGWIAHDEGLLGQLGERTLRGGLPHLDFLDPYTGGLSFFYAGAFQVLGIRADSIRWVLLGAVALVVPFLFGIARRLAPLWLAALATLVAVGWSVPIYFAGLPSWYGLFLAIIALWALLRHEETGQRRWLIVAGLCGGISCLFKITGLYLIAASLLVVVDHEHRGARGVSTMRAQPGVGRGFVLLAALGGFAFTLGLIGLVRPSLGADGGSGSPAALLLHFVLPGAVLAGFVVLREARANIGLPTSRRLRRLLAVVPWLGLGVAVPIAAFVAVFALRGGLPALDALYQGVFVLPQKRFAFATWPLPPVWSVLLALPIGWMMAWPRPLSRGVERVVGVAMVVATVGAVLVVGQDAMYRGLWLPLRALGPVTVVAGVWLLGRRRRDGTTVEAPGRLFAVITITALASLIQYPDAYGIYFLYVAPLLLLAVLATSAANPRAWRAPLLVVLLVLGGFAYGWLHRGHPMTVGLRWLPASWDFPLTMPRGGLEVDRASGAPAHLVAQTILEHTEPGDAVFAAPDCPEVTFLSGTRDPLHSFFAFFDAELDDPATLEALLERENVRVAVINRAPNFSPPLPEPVIRMLVRRYPNRKPIGHLMVLW